MNKLTPEWCKCEGKEQDECCDASRFKDDGECACGISKHHYHGKCGGVTQIG